MESRTIPPMKPVLVTDVSDNINVLQKDDVTKQRTVLTARAIEDLFKCAPIVQTNDPVELHPDNAYFVNGKVDLNKIVTSQSRILNRSSYINGPTVDGYRTLTDTVSGDPKWAANHADTAVDGPVGFLYVFSVLDDNMLSWSNYDGKLPIGDKLGASSTAETVDVIVGYKYYYDPGIKMFTINQDKFQKAYDILNRYSLDITEFKESSIKGNIYLDDNMTVYTSIPYDAGWHVYVDDKEVDTFSIGNALLAFNADKGTHKIKMVYRIPYFRIGLVFSVISLLIIIFSKKITSLFNKIKPKKKHKHKIKEEK